MKITKKIRAAAARQALRSPVPAVSKMLMAGRPPRAARDGSFSPAEVAKAFEVLASSASSETERLAIAAKALAYRREHGL